MEDVGLLYGHLVYFTSIWYSLWTFGIFMVIWYIFPRFGIFYHEPWQHCLGPLFNVDNTFCRNDKLAKLNARQLRACTHLRLFSAIGTNNFAQNGEKKNSSEIFLNKSGVTG
jgi:hypothetical protein